MNKTCKRFISVTVFVAIGLSIYFILQSIIVPYGLDRYGDTRRSLREFAKLDENTVDVIFLGSSLVYNGVSPMRIYEKSGITSYSLASAFQPIEISYCLLKDAFESQKPKVVFLEASSMLHKASEQSADSSRWRFVLDVLPISQTKIEIANLYQQYDFSDDLLSVYIPLIKYHTRWIELTKDDFTNTDIDTSWRMGQSMVSYVEPSMYTQDEIEYWAGKLAERNIGTVNYVENGKIMKEEDSSTQCNPQISNNSIKYLKLINDLCKEHNCELVLFKVPTNTLQQYQSSSWYKEKNQMVSDVAVKNGIPFLDLTYEDTNLDFTEDTCDAGTHLNGRGADKVSDAICGYLKTEFGLLGSSCSTYDRALEKYRRASSIMYLESERSFSNYISLLEENRSDITICMTACADYTANLTEEDNTLLKSLGLELIDQGDFMDAYAAVICGGNVAYEAVSNKKLSDSVSVAEKTIDLVSAGWLVGMASSIRIDGTEFGMNQQGLNIVVMDNATGLVVDTVCFDTYSPERLCYRSNPTTSDMFRKYCNAI